MICRRYDIADNNENLKQIILGLNEEAKRIRLNMNINHAKVMCREDIKQNK